MEALYDVIMDALSRRIEIFWLTVLVQMRMMLMDRHIESLVSFSGVDAFWASNAVSIDLMDRELFE